MDVTMSEYPIAASVPLHAHALRPMLIDGHERPLHYTGTTFPANPYAGCELTIRRMECFGYLLPTAPGSLEGSYFVDVLDSQGDILETLAVTRQGFEYLRRVLRFRRETSDGPHVGGPSSDAT